MKNLLLLTLCTLFCLHTTHASEKKSVCLNMIVKNESKVIERCLESVKPLIDYWVIVDTGSTDGTQKIIQEYMRDIPGELHESEWVNFEHNRTEALKKAKNKGDYLLFIDADEELLIQDDFEKLELEKDYYYIVTDYAGMKYHRVQLVNNHLDWHWEGVVHESVECPDIKTSGTQGGIFNFVRSEGCRSQDPEKFQKDVRVLLDALKTDPNNKRYVFYLAQSYRDAGDKQHAIEYYRKRAEMGGWDQEIFWSHYQIGCLQEGLGLNSDLFLSSYYKAYATRPQRAEPLYKIANYCRLNGRHGEGFAAASLGLSLAYPEDTLFVEEWMYKYGLLMEYSLCAYELGRYADAAIACHKMLQQKDIPEHVKDQVSKNQDWISAKLMAPYTGPYTAHNEGK